MNLYHQDDDSSENLIGSISVYLGMQHYFDGNLPHTCLQPSIRSSDAKGTIRHLFPI